MGCKVSSSSPNTLFTEIYFLYSGDRIGFRTGFMKFIITFIIVYGGGLIYVHT